MLEKLDLKLPQGIFQVTNPDHPFTFDGPDHLLYDDQNLLAIFRIRKNEITNNTRLLARLTNTLIAYPPNTQMILLLNKNDNISPIKRWEDNYFTKIIEISDLKLVKALLKEKKDTKQIAAIKKYQGIIFRNQALIQNNNQDYLDRTNFEIKQINKIEQLRKAQFYDQLKQKYVKVKGGIFTTGNEIVGIKNLKKNASDIVELRPFYEFVINTEFDVDNGVPYATITKKVLTLNEKPSIRFDPIKPTRLASLFGWYIVNSNELSTIRSRISNTKS